MTDNPMVGVIQRMTNMARMHGKAYCKITWDADADTYNFAFILPEHVIITYEEKKHD